MALAQTNLTLYPPGTVLIAMYGEGKTRGKASILKIEAATNQALAAIVFVADSELLRPWIMLILEYGYEATRRLSSGGVQPNLNLSIIRSLPVPLPPPSHIPSIVNEVAAMLSVNDATATSVKLQQARCQRLRQSILKWAFEGKLVDQDPNDEPASVLLERIRAERNTAAQTSKPPARKRRSKKTPSK